MLSSTTPAGGVDCWGYNNLGQLGNPSTTNVTSTPVPVTGVGGTGALTGVTSVTGGYYHSCAVLSSTAAVNPGGVDCWGYNNYGQLGNGTTTNSPTPGVVDAALSDSPQGQQVQLGDGGSGVAIAQVQFTAVGLTCAADAPCSWSAPGLPAGVTVTVDGGTNGQTATLTGTAGSVKSFTGPVTVTQGSTSVSTEQFLLVDQVLDGSAGVGSDQLGGKSGDDGRSDGAGPLRLAG